LCYWHRAKSTYYWSLELLGRASGFIAKENNECPNKTQKRISKFRTVLEDLVCINVDGQSFQSERSIAKF
jgi:hypothetical protein